MQQQQQQRRPLVLVAVDGDGWLRLRDAIGREAIAVVGLYGDREGTALGLGS